MPTVRAWLAFSAIGVAASAAAGTGGPPPRSLYSPAQAAQGAFDRLALVAPPRILSAIRDRMSVGASAKLARTLAKDLTKAPDHELGAWLGALDFA